MRTDMAVVKLRRECERRWRDAGGSSRERKQVSNQIRSCPRPSKHIPLHLPLQVTLEVTAQLPWLTTECRRQHKPLVSLLPQMSWHDRRHRQNAIEGPHAQRGDLLPNHLRRCGTLLAGEMKRGFKPPAS